MKKLFFSMMTLVATTTATLAEEEISPLDKVIQKVTQMEESAATPKLKFSGYIQLDTKLTESEGHTMAPTFNIRRGRLKTSYANDWGQAVLQLDITEKGVGIKDAYVGFQVPTFEWIRLQGGVFDRPFGYEISYSSSLRESPERSRLFTTLFPDERDLGAMLTFQGPKGTFWNNFKLDAGLFAGNGVAVEDVKKYGDLSKDFIGRLTYTQVINDIKISGALSYYNGSVAVGKDAYAVEGDSYRAFEQGEYLANMPSYKDAAVKFAKKEVFGIGATLLAHTTLGTTNLRGEYLFGTQPGLAKSSSSNSSKGYLGGGALTDDVYSRNFGGFYAILVQDIAQSKHSVVLKYDNYDPNIRWAGDQVKTDGDISYSTFGIGYMFRASAQVRLMAYYDFITNETTSESILGGKYKKDIADNMLTVRLQYKF